MRRLLFLAVLLATSHAFATPLDASDPRVMACAGPKPDVRPTTPYTDAWYPIIQQIDQALDLMQRCQHANRKFGACLPYLLPMLANWKAWATKWKAFQQWESELAPHVTDRCTATVIPITAIGFETWPEDSCALGAFKIAASYSNCTDTLVKVRAQYDHTRAHESCLYGVIAQIQQESVSANRIAACPAAPRARRAHRRCEQQ